MPTEYIKQLNIDNKTYNIAATSAETTDCYSAGNNIKIENHEISVSGTKELVSESIIINDTNENVSLEVNEEWLANHTVSDSYLTRAKNEGSVTVSDSYALGTNVSALSTWSIAGGVNSIASGDSTNIALGHQVSALKQQAFAEGLYTLASGCAVHAEGNGTSAIGNYSHAEGYYTLASGDGVHAEGRETIASNFYSHAEGYATSALGYNSHAEGYRTVASGEQSHAQGKFNTFENATNAFIIGNGTSDTARSDALVVDWNGNVSATGYFYDKNGKVGSGGGDDTYYDGNSGNVSANCAKIMVAQAESSVDIASTTFLLEMQYLAADPTILQAIALVTINQKGDAITGETKMLYVSPEWNNEELGVPTIYYNKVSTNKYEYYVQCDHGGTVNNWLYVRKRVFRTADGINHEITNFGLDTIPSTASALKTSLIGDYNTPARTIYENDDLNNYGPSKAGSWRCKSGTVQKTIANNPYGTMSKGNFRLDVVVNTVNASDLNTWYGYQVCTFINGAEIFIRSHNGGSWQSWNRISGTETDTTNLINNFWKVWPNKFAGGTSAGYVKFCTLTLNKTYANAPIEIDVAERSNKFSTYILKFSNSSTTAGYTVASFELTSVTSDRPRLGIVKSSTADNAFILYYNDSGDNNYLMARIKSLKYELDSMTIAWEDSLTRVSSVTDLQMAIYPVINIRGISNIVTNDSAFSSAPASVYKNYFTNSAANSSVSFLYNQSGDEKIAMFSKRNTYGTIFQLNYKDTYPRMLRYNNGTWQSTDWEKIKAGYADTAGNADTAGYADTAGNADNATNPLWNSATTNMARPIAFAWDDSALWSSNNAFNKTICYNNNFKYNPNNGRIEAGGILLRNTDAITFSGAKGSKTAIRFLANTENAYGHGISIGAEGLTIIGGGEAHTAYYAGASFSPDDEDLILATDTNLHFVSNMQAGYNSRKEMTLSKNGVLTTPGSIDVADSITAAGNLNAKGSIVAGPTPNKDTTMAVQSSGSNQAVLNVSTDYGDFYLNNALTGAAPSGVVDFVARGKNGNAHVIIKAWPNSNTLSAKPVFNGEASSAVRATRATSAEKIVANGAAIGGSKRGVYVNAAGAICACTYSFQVGSTGTDANTIYFY